MTIKHNVQTTIADNPPAGGVGATAWDADHVVSGGVAGVLVVTSSGSASAVALTPTGLVVADAGGLPATPAGGPTWDGEELIVSLVRGPTNESGITIGNTLTGGPVSVFASPGNSILLSGGNLVSVGASFAIDLDISGLSGIELNASALQPGGDSPPNTLDLGGIGAEWHSLFAATSVVTPQVGTSNTKVTKLMLNLPTTDPENTGQVWISSGVLVVSTT